MQVIDNTRRDRATLEAWRPLRADYEAALAEVFTLRHILRSPDTIITTAIMPIAFMLLWLRLYLPLLNGLNGSEGKFGPLVLQLLIHRAEIIIFQHRHPLLHGDDHGNHFVVRRADEIRCC
mgnify:CR=1 FL=1